MPSYRNPTPCKRCGGKHPSTQAQRSCRLTEELRAEVAARNATPADGATAGLLRTKDVQVITATHTCPFCLTFTVAPLTSSQLAAQPDDTTHVCHPALGGCNHGFAIDRDIVTRAYRYGISLSEAKGQIYDDLTQEQVQANDDVLSGKHRTKQWGR